MTKTFWNEKSDQELLDDIESFRSHFARVAIDLNWMENYAIPLTRNLVEVVCGVEIFDGPFPATYDVVGKPKSDPEYYRGIGIRFNYFPTHRARLDDFQARLDRARRKHYEVENFNCGGCGKPIPTFWGAKGLYSGNYDLIGDVFFHPRCWEEEWAEYEKKAKMFKGLGRLIKYTEYGWMDEETGWHPAREEKL